MKKLIWITAVVALVACSKKSDDAGKSGGGGGAAASCADAAGKAVAGLGAANEAVKDKLRAIYTARCIEDKWAPEVIKCYESAVGMAALTACRAKLPAELGTKLITEIRGAMAEAGVMMGRPPMGSGGAPPAPAGDPGAGGAAAPGTPATPPK